jgi:hypothetical protein
MHLVFEYVDKNVLDILMEEKNGLSAESVKRYTYQLLKGLQFCHQNNIMHRGNTMLQPCMPKVIFSRYQTRKSLGDEGWDPETLRFW